MRCHGFSLDFSRILTKFKPTIEPKISSYGVRVIIELKKTIGTFKFSSSNQRIFHLLIILYDFENKLLLDDTTFVS